MKKAGLFLVVAVLVVGELCWLGFQNSGPLGWSFAVSRSRDQMASAEVAANAKDWGVVRTAWAKVKDPVLRRTLVNDWGLPASRAEIEVMVNLNTTLSVALLWVPPTPGRGATRGSPEDETDRGDDEDSHTVILTRGYWLGKTEVTQG
jgi:formylglycine-generating enzyme required for sulfatase activity